MVILDNNDTNVTQTDQELLTNSSSEVIVVASDNCELTSASTPSFDSSDIEELFIQLRYVDECPEELEEQGCEIPPYLDRRYENPPIRSDKERDYG